MNKRFQKSLKSEITFWLTVLTKSWKTIDCLPKQSIEILRHLSIIFGVVFENIIEIILNIFLSKNIVFSKREKAPSCLVIKINQSFSSRTVSRTTTGALSWLRQFHHWSDHQTKPSIPFLYYCCNLLYNSACFAESVIILSLYWKLFCCELPGLVILFV